MATATTTRQPRQSRASRGTAAADAGKPTLAAVPSETPKPEPETRPALKAQPKPLASVDLGAKPVTYWFPSATLSDGTTVSCPHARYGHESEAGAKRCIAQLVNQKGHKVG